MNEARNRWILLGVVTAIALGAVVSGRAVSGEDADDVAAKALSEALAKGKALFHDAELGTNEKFCAKCHENPDKPRLHLADRVNDYPKYDKREGRVITLGTKIAQMMDRMLKAERPELGSEKLVAIEAYLMSISRDH